MQTEVEIPVQKAGAAKLNELPAGNIPFGKYFTDHMLEAEYADGEWKNVEIKPYQPLVFSPSMAAIHYGQSIFEGIKAYKNPKGEACIFRPFDNFRRFNRSAARLQMPELPEEIFIEGMRKLVALDQEWIPQKPGHSLYIRPFMFATDEVIGVKPSETYRFMIIMSPTGPYYSAPMRIYVEENYTRAAPGGLGAAKAAGNYAASLLASAEAKAKGYDQVLWMDASEHKYVQEIGTMNVFFIIGNKAFTPHLGQGTILDGVSRNSAMVVLEEMGYPVIEKEISIHELMEAYAAGELKEVFGTGTAVTVARIQELRYSEETMRFEMGSGSLADEILTRLTNIREGKTKDVHGWMLKA